MNTCALIICITIFLNSLGYSFYEFKNKNKLAGISVIILSLITTGLFTYAIFSL